MREKLRDFSQSLRSSTLFIAVTSIKLTVSTLQLFPWSDGMLRYLNQVVKEGRKELKAD